MGLRNDLVWPLSEEILKLHVKALIKHYNSFYSFSAFCWLVVGWWVTFQVCILIKLRLLLFTLS